MREIQSILRESTETGLKVSRGILVWERKLPGFRDLPSVCAFFLALLSRFFSRTCVSCGNGTFYVRKDNCLRQMLLRKNIICNESNFKKAILSNFIVRNLKVIRVNYCSIVDRKLYRVKDKDG